MINVLARKIGSIRIVFRGKEGGAREVAVKVRKVGQQSSKTVKLSTELDYFGINWI